MLPGISPTRDPGEDPTITLARAMQQRRDTRRRAARRFRHDRNVEHLRNIAEGRPGDVDFQRLVKAFRQNLPATAVGSSSSSSSSSPSRCQVFCRKRPVNDRERNESDYDVVTVLPRQVVVHFPKLLVDGFSKRMENHRFRFAGTFDEDAANADVFQAVCAPLVARCVQRGAPGLLFATGQTGSGKTYSMRAILQATAKDLFARLGAEETEGGGEDEDADETDDEVGTKHATGGILVQAFEVYQGSLLDLLREGDPESRVVHAREGRGKRQNLKGLTAVRARSQEAFLRLIARASRSRATKKTHKNATSSRSHWIVALTVPVAHARHTRGGPTGRLTIVDLAGSERHHDSAAHSPQLLRESSHINASLLALKSVIRAIGQRSAPPEVSASLGSAAATGPAALRRELGPYFRASKLTMILRDSFLHPRCHVHVLCCISPTASASHHSLDTLRMAVQLQGAEVEVSLQQQISGSETMLQASGVTGGAATASASASAAPAPVPMPPRSAGSSAGVSPRKQVYVLTERLVSSSLSSSTTSKKRRPARIKLAHSHLNAANSGGTGGGDEGVEPPPPPPLPSPDSWGRLSPAARIAAANAASRRASMSTRASISPLGGASLMRSNGSMLDMMEKCPVLVAVRIRPLHATTERNAGNVIRAVSKTTIAVRTPETTGKARAFTFDAVLPPGASQKQTYQRTGHLLLEKVLAGINGCLFCYGQTGAGKTHTLIGDRSRPGVLLSFVEELFELVARNREEGSSTTTVKCTICEIYKEKLKDLMDTTRRPSIVGNPHGGVHVQDVTVTPIVTLTEMEGLLWTGLANRVTGKTDMNAASSRSHAVITLYVTTQDHATGNTLRSKMIFCDLVRRKSALALPSVFFLCCLCKADLSFHLFSHFCRPDLRGKKSRGRPGRA